MTEKAIIVDDKNGRMSFDFYKNLSLPARGELAKVLEEAFKKASTVIENDVGG